MLKSSVCPDKQLLMAEEAVLGMLVDVVNELGDHSSSDEEDPALRHPPARR